MTPWFPASSKSRWCGWSLLPPGFQFPVKELVASLGGSNALPPCGCSSAVERYPSKLDVVGSIPIIRFSIITIMNNFIGVYDNVLTLEQCDSIIHYIDNSPNIRRGMIASGVNTSMKDSWDINKLFRDENDVDRTIHTALKKCVKDYKIKNPELDVIGQWGLENKYNLQKYLPGGGYPQPHCEASFKNNCHRVIVWMIYLNTVTDDGGTRFPQYDLTTDAVAGRVVLWPTSWTHFHHGIISKTQYKYIATGWYSFLS